MNYSKIVMALLMAMTVVPIGAQDEKAVSEVERAKRIGRIAMHAAEMLAPILYFCENVRSFASGKRPGMDELLGLRRAVDHYRGSRKRYPITTSLLYIMSASSFLHGFFGLKKELKPEISQLPKKWGAQKSPTYLVNQQQ